MIHLPEWIQFLAYVILLWGWILQTIIISLQYIRRNKSMKRIKEAGFLLLQLVLVVLATYNLSSINALGTAQWYTISVMTFPLGLMVFVRSLFHGWRIIREMRTEITTFSVLEALETLESGLLFYDVDGQILLVNTRMKELQLALFHQVFLNGNALWYAIRQYTDPDKENNTSVSVPIGEQVYGFRISPFTVKGKIYTVLSASDITQVHAQWEILKRKNRMLKESNDKIHEMIQNVDALADMNEKLRIKMALHDLLGQQYSVLRAVLTNYEEYAISLQKLRPTKVMELLQDTSGKSAEENLEALRRYLKTIGIHIAIHKDPSIPQALENIFHMIAMEAITNGIIHGNAQNFVLHYTESATLYQLSVENDGVPATEEIVEGGGIKGMRMRLQEFEGSLTLEKASPFTITANIPKKE